jgi:hypothetical protein
LAGAPEDRIRAAAAHLREVEEGTSYGTFALKLRGKSFCRLKDSETLVLLCAMEEKEFLLAAAPAIYFETDHYKGWPALLVRLAAIDDDELSRRLEAAWLGKAPKRLAQAFPTRR